MLLAVITVLIPSWLKTPNWIEYATFAGAVLFTSIGGWRFWQAYRRRTLLRVKPIKSTWQELDSNSESYRWLKVDIEFIARELFQITYIELEIGGRHCGPAPEDRQLMPKKRKEMHSIRFTVPDVWKFNNHANLKMKFGGTEFQSNTFKVNASP